MKQRIELASQAATEELACRLALWARPGMLVALNGDLGAGKSTFARAFIRSLFRHGTEEDIPSPSFSLIQIYDSTRVPAFHADLYRITSPDEIAELGLEELLTNHVGLIEWAERLPRPMCADTLDITLSGSGSTRIAELEARGNWVPALARDQAISNFVSGSEFAACGRSFFEGDASSRRYEMLKGDDGRHCLLMDMPTRPDGPVVKDGKPYSAIAHLAEGLTAVVAINTHLVNLGYSAPRIIKHDLAHGLALIEPLGFNVYGKMMLAGENMHAPMFEAAALLADMALRDWPSSPEAAPGIHHNVSPYDPEALLIEADLLPSWFHPHVRGSKAPESLNASFAAEWQKVLHHVTPDKPQWVLRDFHSPNLLWIPERGGLKRVGLIDTQDAVMGHAAYDLMSMVQDARVDVDFGFGRELVEHYCGLRHGQGGFDEASFKTAYAVLGAQRATKILGIFARLAKRDGKPGYLRHMPRVSRYLALNLEHPVLAGIRRWYETELPEALSVGRT